MPDLALAAAIVEWAVTVDSAEQRTAWRPATSSQSVTSATNRRGELVHFVHNWAWEDSAFELPAAVTDVITGEELAIGDRVHLGAWDVRIFAESATE